jgi:ABC-type multidrug transport system fused ATPase/permease subunit
MADDVKPLVELLHKKQDAQTEKLNELAISVAKQEVIVDQFAKQADRTSDELSKLNGHMANYNAELRVHIAGVAELKAMHSTMKQDIEEREKATNARLEVAEQPAKWAAAAAHIMKVTYHWMKWIAAFATSLGLLFAVIKWIATNT